MERERSAPPRPLLDACWYDAGIILIADERLEGRDTVEAGIAAFRSERPQDLARLTGPIEQTANWVRFDGEVLRPDGTTYGPLTDVGQLGADGRFLRIITFARLR